MPCDDFLNFGFINLPNSYLLIGAHCQTILAINSKIAVPYPMMVTRKCLVVVKPFILRVILPDFATFVGTACSQKSLVGRKLALQDVSVVVSLSGIDWFEIFCFLSFLWVPEAEETSWVAHDKFACVFWNLKGCDGNRWEIILFKRPWVESLSFLNLWLPNFDIAVLVSKNNFNFVWMKNGTIDLDSRVVILSLKSFTFEIKSF